MAIILLAEGTTTVRMAVGETLIRLGHEVIEATNGAEAIAQFESDEPDTVLLDIAMPTRNESLCAQGDSIHRSACAGHHADRTRPTRHRRAGGRCGSDGLRREAVHPQRLWAALTRVLGAEGAA